MTMKDMIVKLLEEIGEDPGREGLKKTPKRWVDAMHELTSGYSQNLGEVANGAVFPAENSEMVIIKDIEFYSLCEHHLLPFVGRVHVGYVPDEKIIGFSKIPRIVEMYAKRLQVQERLGQEICDAIDNIISPKGIGVLVEATHLCMSMRGIAKESAKAVTTHMKGDFSSGVSMKEEFLRLVTPPIRSTI